MEVIRIMNNLLTQENALRLHDLQFENMIASKDAVIAGKDKALADKDQELAGKEQQIERLRALLEQQGVKA